MIQSRARSTLMLLAGACALMVGFAAAAGEEPKTSPAPTDTKAYCKQMYGKAYMLCGMSDHDCKFLAADKWERCEQTGRWP